MPSPGVITPLCMAERDRIMKQVRDFYNRHRADEDRRLNDNALEMPVTLKYVERYLSKGSKVLDVACGTGRYAHALMQKGYLVSVNDLSEHNMALTLKRTKDHPNLQHASVSDALEAEIWEREQWDAVLILGPMYHLPDYAQRLALLQRARKKTKRGCMIYSAFMSRTAALLFGLKTNPGGILHHSGVKRLWETGTDETFIEGTEWFTRAYFSFPGEVAPLIRDAGLQPVHLVGIEGIFGENMDLYHNLDAHLQKKWKQFIMDHCEDQHMIHNSKHLLSVARH